MPIIDDDEPEPNEHFYVKLTGADALPAKKGYQPVNRPRVQVRLSTATVTVFDNDLGGVFGFEQDALRVADTGRGVVVRVLRRDGNKGRATVDFATSDGKAIRGRDYVQASGRLVFEEGELVKEVLIPIIPVSAYDDKEEEFYVHLSKPSSNAALEQTTSGKAQSRVTCSVIIRNDSELQAEVRRLARAPLFPPLLVLLLLLLKRGALLFMPARAVPS